ncbi:MAG: hypothetical protein DRP09_19085, partial [Candidatus Thorarchaeota archaeon]
LNHGVDYVLLVGDDDYTWKKGFIWVGYIAKLIRDQNIVDDYGSEVPTAQVHIYDRWEPNDFFSTSFSNNSVLDTYKQDDNFDSGIPDAPDDDSDDPDQIPPPSGEYKPVTTASDLPYACLDGVSTYGVTEYTEEGIYELSDFLAEVYVGRAPVTTASDLKNFVKKTVSYMNANENVYRDASMVGEFLWDYPCGDYCTGAQYGGPSKDEIAQKIQGSAQYNKIHKLYEKDQDWSKGDLINLINNGKADLLNHLGHANIQYCFKLCVDKEHNDHKKFSNDENDGYGIWYSQGCFAGAFDYGDDRESLAEACVVKTDHGAVAGVWNTHFGWGTAGTTDGPSQRYDLAFFEALFNGNLIPRKTLGEANEYSKESNLGRLGTDLDGQIMKWLYICIELFGDPALRVKGLGDLDPPEISNINADPSSQQTGGSISITCDVSDNFAVDNVQVSIIYPDNSVHDFSMQKQKGDRYFFDQTYNTVGTYRYHICARDTANNYNESAEHVFTITGNINNPPIANDDYYSTAENTTLNIEAPGVLTNDDDVDGDTLTTVKTSEPVHGTLTVFNNDGSFIYVPDSGYTGLDNFTYQVDDGNSGTDTATVYITISDNPVNIPPVADFRVEPNNNIGIQNTVFFNSTSYDPDGTIISWEWDFDDGSTGSGEQTTHTYTNPGIYQVKLTVTDDNDTSVSITRQVIISKATFSVSLIRPKTGCIYMFNREIPVKNLIIPLIIGRITIKAEINGIFENGLVELYIDHNQVANFTEKPYEYTYNEKIFGMHTIEVVAKDKEGNIKTDTADALMIIRAK